MDVFYLCHSPDTRLRQCLINLINNAVKFTETGHVHVSVSLEENDNKPFIRFDVEDTGIGILYSFFIIRAIGKKQKPTFSKNFISFIHKQLRPFPTK